MRAPAAALAYCSRSVGPQSVHRRTKHVAPRGAVERAAGRQVRGEISTVRSAQRRLPHRPEMLKQTPHALSVRAVLVLLVSGRMACMTALGSPHAETVRHA